MLLQMPLDLGRQERAPSVPGVQLPVDHPGQAVHLHHPDAHGRGLEPDPVQPGRLHQARVRHQLRRDAARPDSRQLQNQARLLLGPALLGGRAAGRVQALPARVQQDEDVKNSED